MAKKSKPKTKTTRIDSHQALQASYKKIAAKVNKDPRQGLLFLINPMLLFEHMGFELSPVINRHIRHSTQYSPKVRKRADTLRNKIIQQRDFDPEKRAESTRFLKKVSTKKVPVDLTNIHQVKLSNKKQRDKLGDVRRYYKLRRKHLRVFRNRNVFQKYASGEKKIPWLTSLKFKLP